MLKLSRKISVTHITDFSLMCVNYSLQSQNEISIREISNCLEIVQKILSHEIQNAIIRIKIELDDIKNFKSQKKDSK